MIIDYADDNRHYNSNNNNKCNIKNSLQAANKHNTNTPDFPLALPCP